MAVNTLCPPIPKEIKKGVARVLNHVVKNAALNAPPEDLLLEVYMAGLYHGQALSEQLRLAKPE